MTAASLKLRLLSARQAGRALSTAWLPDPTSATGGILAATTATGTGQWLLGDPFANVTAATSTTTATATGLAPLTAFGQPAAPATGTMTDQPVKGH